MTALIWTLAVIVAASVAVVLACLRVSADPSPGPFDHETELRRRGLKP